MEVKILYAAALLAAVAPAVFADTQCTYMIAIPRPPTPEFEELDLEGLTWNERPLFPPPAREEVCMEKYTQPNNNVGQPVIYMEEEIEGDVIIAKINYQGTDTPTIGIPFISGIYNMLMPEIRNIDGELYLVVTQRQDYETPGMQFYSFLLIVTGQPLQALVTVYIVNIDDNAPIIHAISSCDVPELGQERLTECVYEVSDIDGEISTRFMTFEVLSDRGDDEIFYMRGENIPSVWNRMYMTVGITRPLNFTDNQLHIFTVVAKDSLPNNATVSMVVRVINVDHRPPRWVEIFAMQRFDEKSRQEFTIRAVDGDTEINNAIYYNLIADEEDTFFTLENIEGGHNGAILHVAPIDRDALEREVFQLTVVAYKANNESLYIDYDIVIIVNDINDQEPEPFHREYRISIEEETPLTLALSEFGFHDRDLGEHARYSVEILEAQPPEAITAFYISPMNGYQRQTFFMGTEDHTILDYDYYDENQVLKFQNIVLTVMATDLNNTDFKQNATVYVDLVNWNDEIPMFEEINYEFSFNETVEKDFYVGTVRAHDRDIDDRVGHSLMGNAGEYLRIDKDTGDIFVAIDNAFDYHRQNVLFLQVRADDTLGEPYHTTTTQVVIQLEDVNNTPPTLRLPRVSPSVEENVPQGYEVENSIRGTDPDTTAHLVFEINWDESWAAKQGRPTPAIEYHNCVEIHTVYDRVVNGDDDSEENRGTASGVITVNEIRHNVTIDYEEFEVLYLAVRVRDLNTVYGDAYDEAIFTINIIDMNDNKPIFTTATNEQDYRVTEVSITGTVIGSVQATDIDGPLYNQIHYTIVPRNDTPEGLVSIDLESGQIRVDANEAIDADEPPRYFLYYTVIASDKCLLEECPPDPTYWNEELEISIDITDTNNKVPVAETTLYNTTVWVWENETTGFNVVQLIASDLDRDEVYHTVRYEINYAWDQGLRRFFDIHPDSGQLFLNFTTDEVLDRDFGEQQHDILVNIIDNFNAHDSQRNQISTNILVILLDVNDQAPILEEMSWSISESTLAGTAVGDEIFARDYDEPGTDNSRVGYELLDMRVTDRDIEFPRLFTTELIEDPEGNRAKLQTLVDLRGFWGTYEIHIKAYDHGDPPLNTTMWYPVVINPYNYHDPVFEFPLNGTSVRLATELAAINGRLVTATGTFLDRVYATDEDGLDAGRVSFTVVGNAEAMEYFRVDNEDANYGSLVLLRIPENFQEFQITIRATDHGTDPGSRSSETTLTAIYVPTIGEPIFETREQTVLFTEGPTGLEQEHVLTHAVDLKNFGCTDDCRDIYYRIVGGNSDGYFGLDPVQNRLYLVRQLSLELGQLEIIVAASNTPDATGIAQDTSTVAVTVIVIEEDPKPIFVRDLYTAGISVFDLIQRELLTVQATHSLNDAITYTIDWESMQVDPSLNSVRDGAFLLDSTTGVLTLNIQPTASMHGMFEFDVIATDSGGQYDTAQVKVYLVSERNRVYFRFENTVEHVENSREFIETTLTTAFLMICNIDQVVQASDSNGVVIENKADVHAHFIRNDVPVPAEEIEPLRSDTRLLVLIQQLLREEDLVLEDLMTNLSPEEADLRQLTVYVLAALSALLALLCIILILTYIFRTRALNRRLEALAPVKYGSVDSGLNRAHIAPNTNIHAMEGSNPIYNTTLKSPDFDALSDMSDNSDLIGIEDLPQFQNNFVQIRTSSSLGGYGDQDEFDEIATHRNDFGFSTKPGSSRNAFM